MSFERTKNSIENLSNMETITLDLLFDMMVCVSQDVLNYNKTDSFCDTKVADKDVFLKKVYNLMQMTLSVYKKNKEGLTEFSSSIQERYAKLVDEMNCILPEVAEANEQIEIVEAKKKELSEKQNDLQKSRGHLLTVSADCENIQRQIGILSDSALDEKAREKESLELELLKRQESERKIEEEKSEICANIDRLTNRVETLRKNISVLKNEKTDLNNEENSLLTKKNGLEKDIENLKQKIKEYKEWIDNYPSMSEKISVEHDEEKAKITTMINAVNSALSDEYLKENLFKTPDAYENCSVEENPDYVVAEASFENIQELQLWFNNMSERINGLINIYETLLRSFVNQSDKLTRE